MRDPLALSAAGAVPAAVFPRIPRPRWKLSKSESKASPIGQDLKIIVLSNVAVLAAMAVFAVLGMGVAHLATGAAFI